MSGEREFTEIFVEGTVGLTLDNGTARIVFGRKDPREACERLSPPEQMLAFSDDPLVHPTHCLVLPMAGLMQLVSVLQVFLEDERTQQLLGAAQRMVADYESAGGRQAGAAPGRPVKDPASAV